MCGRRPQITAIYYLKEISSDHTIALCSIHRRRVLYLLMINWLKSCEQRTRNANEFQHCSPSSQRAAFGLSRLTTSSSSRPMTTVADLNIAGLACDSVKVIVRASPPINETHKKLLTQLIQFDRHSLHCCCEWWYHSSAVTNSQYGATTWTLSFREKIK